MNLFVSFRNSFREFKKLRSVILSAMLLAIHTVLSVFISIPVAESVRISISFIANVLTGCLFGPVVALISAALGDILQLMIKPTGAWFYGWTLNAALAGLVYGITFYGKLPKDVPAHKNTNHNDSRQTASGILQWFPVVASLGILLCFATAPFLTITEKITDEHPVPAVLADGTALQGLIGYRKAYFIGSDALASVSKTAMMLAILVLVISILTGLLSLRKKHALPLLLAILTCFILLLALYTDRKTTTGHWGFYLIALLFLTIALCHAAELIRSQKLDLGFLLRTLLATTIVCLLINGLLGTYWCTVMYGKHFMVYFLPRFMKNLIQIPINVALIYSLLSALAKVPDFRRLVHQPK